MTSDCMRDADVVAAVLAGRLDRCDDLRTHVAACRPCSEAATVAALLRDDRDAGLADVHVPAAGQVWWRAAVRARLDATQAAARPLTWAHGIAAACVAGLTAGVMTMAWPTIGGFGVWLGERAGVFSPDAIAATGLAATMLRQLVPMSVAAACLLLAPIALYVALSERGEDL